MKQVSKLATAIAVALGVGFASQANAIIEWEDNAKGDALIFPVFVGYSGFENYFTVLNDSANWIQGHLRFRGAAWSGELRDFDVILSPGDVFVFRVADLDGDGMWEIDQSIDPKNFQYTGQYYPDGDHECVKSDNTRAKNCLGASPLLIPAVTPIVSAADIEHHKRAGYVEYFGEAVLTNMTHAIMADLLKTAPLASNKPYQDEVFQKTGTNVWRWTDAANGYRVCGVAASVTTAGTLAGGRCNNGVTDVPNVLSGTGFVGVVGRNQSMAYNAESFVNFRTSMTPHRIDNYPFVAGVDAGTPVILHDETSSRANGPSPYGDYVYIFETEDRQDEKRISFNNTWGPTLADGDDYNMTGLRLTCASTFLPQFDDWECATIAGSHYLNSPNPVNSIAEVEEAIREGLYGQRFTGYYLANKGLGGSALESWYAVHFPTKFYYGESNIYYGKTVLLGANGYLTAAVEELLKLGKPMDLEVWDIEENTSTPATPGCISPCVVIPPTLLDLRHELTFLTIGQLKTYFPNISHFNQGRLVMSPRMSENANNPMVNKNRSWPMMVYTFESVGLLTDVGQWRSLAR